MPTYSPDIAIGLSCLCLKHHY